MLKFLRIIRFPNLLIVGITLSLLYFIILQPTFKEASLDLLIKPYLFFLLALTTIIITLSGYIINDIKDRALDKINKPKQYWIKSIKNLKTAWYAYTFVVIFGSIIAFYIAIQIDQLIWFIIYPISIFLLYIYATTLKSTVLLGNILVSVFCAGVAGILLFAEMKNLTNLQLISPENHSKVIHIFWAYMGYAFISNLIREIIKDMEDLDGDQALGIRTLSTVYGFQQAKAVALSLSLLFIVGLVIWIILDRILFDPMSLTLSLTIIVGSAIHFLYLLARAQTKKQISFLSRYAKYIMILGLFLLLIIQ